MKTKRLNFRISDETDAVIRDKAKAAKMSITDYVISATTQKEIINFEGLSEVVTQIKRLGNNVNQLLILARQDRIRTVNLSETQEELKQIYELLSAILRRR
ncbi:plasmid mobilization protein [Massiliimalia massiliensis]|uniref:plasmid mobilization protein n=1 Tax=Massiliimalia massiliensis TaxID=1852384 RepID=UPI0009857313|nr:DUF1778 domain-containing protein [Massiliimalia massiliensis]